jgi:hypothetical protein
MPTPDASAFTRQNKLRGVQNQVNSTNKKVSTSLYQYVPNTTSSSDFLPSFTNKLVAPYTLPIIRASLGSKSVQFNNYRPNYIH